ncbi:TIR-only protein-like [Juglans microcarpa x Juglans regia]|uniref:TIR-only protein-like n=1 Tax=Juglans microcarpa x Juglans regia TaxID=2249226 RepID=UPI001B7EFC0F|nr:TIR-only protein-like [Juglans microcarpa x Juglans regia]
MQRSLALSKSYVRPWNQIQKLPRSSHEVFISHRGIDTRRNLAGLLYDHLFRLRLRPFLDCRNLKPGDRLFEKIDTAVRDCKVGVAVFSPRYCESYFCLRELARMMEYKKRVIPIFCDVKPSQLRFEDNGSPIPEKEIEGFRMALEEAKFTVGLTFDSSKGYELVRVPRKCLRCNHREFDRGRPGRIGDQES